MLRRNNETVMRTRKGNGTWRADHTSNTKGLAALYYRRRVLRIIHVEFANNVNSTKQDRTHVASFGGNAVYAKCLRSHATYDITVTTTVDSRIQLLNISSRREPDCTT